MAPRLDKLLETARRLQSQHLELVRSYARNREHYLLLRCAFCDIKLGWKRNPEPSPINVSHGVCPECYPKVFPEEKPSPESSNLTVGQLPAPVTARQAVTKTRNISRKDAKHAK
jgi:hypothetical protein